VARVRAVGPTEFGDPEVLHVLDLPQPDAGPGQLRIRVDAAAVNPTDTLRRNGARAAELKDVPMPHVPGMDAARDRERLGGGRLRVERVHRRPGDDEVCRGIHREPSSDAGHQHGGCCTSKGNQSYN